MKEELISFETAKLAKEKGFEFEGSHYLCEGEDIGNIGASIDCGIYAPAPTQSLLQKWLRDNHDVDVYIIPNGMRDKNINDRLYHPCIWFKDEYQTELHSKYSYEQALEKGLQESLKLIKL